MNRFIALLKIVSLFNLVCPFSFGQTSQTSSNSKSTIIKLDSLYKGYGVVFSQDNNPGIVISDLKQRYTPSVAEITAAEQIFLSQYNKANKAEPARKNAKHINNPKSYFNKYYRQYIGFIDNRGNKNILIHLIDFSKPRKVKKYVGDGWKDNFVIVFAQPMPFSILTYRVNMGENKLFASFWELPN